MLENVHYTERDVSDRLKALLYSLVIAAGNSTRPRSLSTATSRTTLVHSSRV